MFREIPRALVIEDEPSIAYLLSRLLGFYFWDVDRAGTAAEALALLAAKPYDVVLLDLMLPDGDGTEVLRMLRASQSTIPVVITTGTTPEVQREALALAPDLLLAKPIHWDTLKDFLQRIQLAFRPRERA